MVNFRLRCLLGIAVVAGSAWPARAADGCASLMPAPATSSRPPRDIRATDLIELRQVGFPDAALSGPNPLALSPNGKFVAFGLMRADVETNSYSTDRGRGSSTRAVSSAKRAEQQQSAKGEEE